MCHTMNGQTVLFLAVLDERSQNLDQLLQFDHTRKVHIPRCASPHHLGQHREAHSIQNK